MRLTAKIMKHSSIELKEWQKENEMDNKLIDMELDSRGARYRDMIKAKERRKEREGFR